MTTIILSAVLDAATLVFAVSSMLSVGLGFTTQEIIGPLRNVSAVIRALLANFVLVPLLAFVVVQVFPLNPSLALGLMLIASAAGAPFLIKLTATAGGRVGLSATLLILLMPVTIVFLPLVVPLLAPAAQVNAGAIARPLILTMLLPLAVGIFVREHAERLAESLQPIMSSVASVALVALIVSTILLNIGGILGIFGTGALLASIILVTGAFLIGYALGSPDRDAQTVLGLGTGQRNVAAATVVATQAIGDPSTIVMVVVSSLVGLAILFPIASALRRHEQREAPR